MALPATAPSSQHKHRLSIPWTRHFDARHLDTWTFGESGAFMWCAMSLVKPTSLLAVATQASHANKMGNTNMTIQEFVRSAHISMRAERTLDNPNMDCDGDKYPMDHWRCVLRAGTSRLTITFSMGMAHNGKPPKVYDVLDCLALDSASVEDSNFENFARDLGFDEDSRKAEKTYKTCKRQSVKLRKFLGDSAYETLLRAERL